MTLLDLPDAKNLLGITGADKDVDVQSLINVASEQVTRLKGPLESVTVTETVRAAFALRLTTQPVSGLTSVTGDRFGVMNIDNLRVDTDAGIVTSTITDMPLLWDTYTVVYTAGYDTVPASFTEAAKVIVAYLYAARRGGTSTRPTLSGKETTIVPGVGELPTRAVLLLGGFEPSAA